MSIYFSNLLSNWKEFFSNKKQTVSLVFYLLLVIIISSLFKYFLIIFEKIDGVQLYDIILQNIPSIDVSVHIFIVLYVNLLITVLYLLNKPYSILEFLQIFSLLMAFRFIFLMIFQLEPPVNYVYIIDPILSNSTYNGHNITKDLFFSGHMITILSCYFVVKPSLYKKYLFIVSLVISVLLLIQHIHYTIDIFGAYIFAFLLYHIFKRINDK